MPGNKLVYMANQIGTFFASQRGDAAAAIAIHLAKFWDPRMRAGILDHLDAGGEGLDPAVRAAARETAAAARCETSRRPARPDPGLAGFRHRPLPACSARAMRP